MDFRKDEDRLEPLALFSQSSLTDIVLLLLIFFLLTSSFVTNFAIQVNLPEAETAAQTESQNVTVAITAKGEYFVDGERVSSGMLTPAIREARSNKPGSALVLRADRETILDNAVRVMNVAQALQMRVLIATERNAP